METISNKKHVARKEHRCDYCNLKISIGQKYDSAFLSYDGTAYTWKSHLHCIEIANELKMYDDCDEGVTSDHFYEYIQNEFIKIIGENDIKSYTFEERLNLVLNHYKIQVELTETV